MSRNDQKARTSRLLELLRETEDIGSALDGFVGQGFTLTIEDLRAVSGQAMSRYAILPEFVSDFVVDYCRSQGVNALFDPSAGFGELVLPIVSSLRPSRAVALVETKESFEWVSRTSTGQAGLEVERADGFEWIEESQEQFDAVVSPLRFGWRKTERKYPWGVVRDEAPRLLMLEAAGRLASHGFGAFTVTPSFFFDRSPHRVYANLESAGLYIDAAIYIPPGSLAPFTSIAAYLVIVRKSRPDGLFVGELTKDARSARALLRNLLNRRPGKLPQLGSIADSSVFDSFPGHLSLRAVESHAEVSRLEAIALADIASEIRWPDKAKAFEPRPNAVYIPSIGNSPVVTSIEDATVKPQNLIQVVLDPEVVDASFFARFMSTPFGEQQRATMARGTIIQHITKGALLSGTVYLPPRELHTDMLRLDTRLSNVASQLESLQTELWRNPHKLPSTAMKLDELVKTHSDRIEAWIDVLPAPIATILWAYHTEAESKAKVEVLFHFFEGFAEYFAIVLIAGFKHDPELARTVLRRVLWASGERSWLERADFGAWIVCSQQLSKEFRRRAASPDERERLLRAFGYPTADFQELLTSKHVLGLLEQARELRNLWPGHGPTITVQLAAKLLTQLENILARLRDAVGDRFSSAMLLKAETARRSSGVVYHNARWLRGSRPRYPQVTVETMQMMDEDKLYLRQRDQPYPIELPPFIQLGPDPEELNDTFYFYSRLHGEGQARFVAYQYAREPEGLFESDPILAYLDAF